MSERPETGRLLDETRTFIARYVALPDPDCYLAIALWVLHAHAIAAFETSPRLLLKSAEKESGKTRALEVLELLTPAPLNSFNATIAAIFRLLKEEQKTTLLFDEVDAIFSPKAAKENEDLRALVNAGHRRGSSVARVVGDGKKMRVERFPVFAPTALAAIGNLPDTIESRSIIIPMRRRAPDEAVAQFRRRRVEHEAAGLNAALVEWAEAYIPLLSEADPVTPDEVRDRAADCWEPLLAIAELAGGEWESGARAAAKSLAAGRVAEDQSVGVQLLADTHRIFTAEAPADRLSTATLLERLNALEESGWGGWNDGKGMNARDLARRLKPYGIHPKTIREDDTTSKGYDRGDFADGWARYLRQGSVTSVTAVTQIRIPVTAVTAVTPLEQALNGESPALEVDASVEDDDYFAALSLERS